MPTFWKWFCGILIRLAHCTVTAARAHFLLCSFWLWKLRIFGTSVLVQLRALQPLLILVKIFMLRLESYLLFRTASEQSLSAEQSYQLLTRAKHVFREQYVRRLLVARDELDRRWGHHVLHLEKCQRTHAISW